VTTEALNPWDTHKEYGKRATCETWIEESKNQIGMEHIRTSEFLANAALFQCAVLAYNVVRWMALMSANTKLRQWEITSSIRRNGLLGWRSDWSHSFFQAH